MEDFLFCFNVYLNTRKHEVRKCQNIQTDTTLLLESCYCIHLLPIVARHRPRDASFLDGEAQLCLEVGDKAGHES